MASGTDNAAKPKLVVIRGNSGSGKSSVARMLQRRYDRSCALVEQDHLRRIVLRERDVEGGLAPHLIEHVARFALDHGRHVVVEGILAAARYRHIISDLVRDHRGEAYVFYLDVPLEETLRRHAQRPQASEFTAQDMRSWYLPCDVLGMDCEQVIGPLPTLDALEEMIARRAGFLSRRAAQTDASST
ncbi:kinase [Luedemannella flava]|uniref:Kinase n=1 Tax=Luedemannella flava TaxID=349316 RepID=A0ABP4Y862_9ACTN